jgi:hypothetical protein
MATLGVQVSLPKVALAWVGEKVTRLKSNGRLVRRSPLPDLVELEVMYLRISGKEAGWHTLRIVADSDDRLDVDRLDELIARARRQVATLERLRQEEARRLFAPTTGGGSPAPAAG